jgi:hypothetical protein
MIATKTYNDMYDNYNDNQNSQTSPAWCVFGGFCKSNASGLVVVGVSKDGLGENKK